MLKSVYNKYFTVFSNFLLGHNDNMIVRILMLSITTFSIIFQTLSINDIHHNDTQHNETEHAECVMLRVAFLC